MGKKAKGWKLYTLCKSISGHSVLTHKHILIHRYRNIQANYKNRLEISFIGKECLKMNRTFLCHLTTHNEGLSMADYRHYTAKIARIPIRLKLQQIAQSKLIPPNIYMKENQK